TDCLVGIGTEARECGGELRPQAARPGEHDAVDDRDRTRRIGRTAKRLSNPDQLTGHDVAHYDLVAIRRGFDDAHPAVEEQKEGLRLHVLLENEGVLWHAPGCGALEHLVE